MENFADLDWTLIRVFLAVAEAGSLSGAARATGISQPTLSRHVREAEAMLGVPLFHRHPRGLALTETGAALLDPARAMKEAAGRLALVAAGEDRRVAGRVRLTASVYVAHFVLPPILARLRAEHPELTFDLIASDSSENLLFREADIAIRMYRPRQLDMMTRHVGDLQLGLFAAKTYLDARGRPVTIDEAMDHDWIGYDRNDAILRGMAAAGHPVERDFFVARTDDQAAHWQLVRGGLGLGFGQLAVGLADPGLERLLPDLAIPALPVWLTTPERLRHSPRIARVWDALAEALQA